MTLYRIKTKRSPICFRILRQPPCLEEFLVLLFDYNIAHNNRFLFWQRTINSSHRAYRSNRFHGNVVFVSNTFDNTCKGLSVAYCKGRSRLAVHCRQNCLNHNKDFENDLISITSGLKNSNLYHSRFENPSFTGLIFHFDSALNVELRSQKQQKFFEDIRTDIDKLVDKSVNFAILPLSDAEIAVIIVFDLSCQSNRKQLKESYFSQFTRSVHSNYTDHFAITSIKLSNYENFSSLEQEIKLLQKIISVRVIRQFGKQLSLEDMKLYAEEKHLLKICDTLTQLQTYYIKNDYLNFTKLASELGMMFNHGTLLNKEMKSNIAYYLKAAMDCSVAFNETLRQWSNKIEQRGEAVLAAASTCHDDVSMIDQVKKYIDENYMKEIGITEISDILNITPNYLSTLFHKEIGLTFTKYLTNTRMLKAKELLLNPNNKVQYVANSVGYFNTRYFTKLFKSYYNYYPSECVNKSSSGLPRCN